MRKIDSKKHPKLLKFLEKTQKVLKGIAVVCFSLLVVLFTFYMARSCLDERESAVITASAEEATTVADVESGIDSTLYPSANLILYPYLFDKEVNDGITCTVNVDGSLTLNGTSTALAVFTLRENIILKVGEVYTMRGSISTYGITVVCQSVDSANVYNIYTGTVAKVPMHYVYFTVQPGFVLNNVKVYPMLNVGDVAYPFIPNLDGVYNNGYNAGYGAGETAGYENGYSEGLTYAKYGFWDSCTVNVRFTKDVGYLVQSTYNYKPTLINNGISLSGLSTWFSNYISSGEALSVSNISFSLSFSPAVPNSRVKIRGSGASYIFEETSLFAGVVGSGTVIGSDLNARFTLIDGATGTYGLQLQDVDSVNAWNLEVLGGFTVNSYQDFTNLQFFSTDTGYDAGYQSGYNAGLQEGLNDTVAYDKGYEIGFSEGKSVGFQEGFAQTENGGLTWLISSVQEFLSYPFFGAFSVGNLLYIGLGITLVVMFLRLFAGG